jgi:hypothetical protein
MKPRKEMASGRKVPISVQDSATTIFFMPVMSFNLKLDIFILYIAPIQKGKRIIKIESGFCKRDKEQAAIYDTIVAHVTKRLFFFINPALSGTFTESSFMSVNLLRLYIANMRRKEAMSKLKLTFTSQSKKEK